ncbi:Tetratricopeptide-like helical domain superfamily [Babesia duncani]|uniref:Tetratricopeptide-like helical domain superfamily n=1 Tax=Babesia duncani TaxID=323732 RepID=A0AAD9PMN3_9APIC|nr:Tetratricopeptide-like helical domain superfamily [Babesia duncani]
MPANKVTRTVIKASGLQVPKFDISKLHAKPHDPAIKPLETPHKDVGHSILDLKNKLHKRLWVTIKRRDHIGFDRVQQQLRNSGIKLDSVTYTLLHGGAMALQAPSKALDILNEMKVAQVHPTLVRMHARMLAACTDLQARGVAPNNIVQTTRALWLVAHQLSRRHPQQ